MSISTTITAIQTVNEGITGITSAPTSIPGRLNTADLPMALCFVGPGYATEVSNFGKHHRTYWVRVYVKPVSQDTKPDAGYSEAYTLLQRFVEEYLSDITFSAAIDHLGRGAMVNAVPTMEDSGILALEYAGTLYHGFEITIEAKETVT